MSKSMPKLLSWSSMIARPSAVFKVLAMIFAASASLKWWKERLYMCTVLWSWVFGKQEFFEMISWRQDQMPRWYSNNVYSSRNQAMSLETPKVRKCQVLPQVSSKKIRFQICSIFPSIFDLISTSSVVIVRRTGDPWPRHCGPHLRPPSLGKTPLESRKMKGTQRSPVLLKWRKKKKEKRKKGKEKKEKEEKKRKKRREKRKRKKKKEKDSLFSILSFSSLFSLVSLSTFSL